MESIDLLWLCGVFAYTFLLRSMDWWELEQRESGRRWVCGIIGFVATQLSWLIMLKFVVTQNYSMSTAAALACGLANFRAADKSRKRDSQS